MFPGNKEVVLSLGMLLIVSIFFDLAHGGSEKNVTKLDHNSSCVPAESSVNDSTKNAACIFYKYIKRPGGLCNDIITSLYVFGNKSTLDYGETETSTFQSYFNFFEIGKKCKPIMRDLFCRYHFAPCDTTLEKPRMRRICRRTCEHLDFVLCRQEMVFIRNAAKTAPRFDHDMINCSTYVVANGGDAPECYQYQPLRDDDTTSTDCFHGIGVGYRGHINVTRSGRTCQQWTSQCPHRHWRIPDDVVSGQNYSNMCRNPEGSAPNGPWCYTTDPNVRWEYCNVSRCPPRVPEGAPTSLQGYPVNATAIQLAWEGIPPNLSSYKEKLLGYRIRYRRLGSRGYSKVNVTHNVTETMIIRLVPHTGYEIKVDGFNVIGHGPPSKVLIIKTLPSGFVIVDVMLQVVLDADFNNGYTNRSSSMFREMQDRINTMMRRQFNRSSVLEIYDMRILLFSSGSLKADISVLTTINTERTTKDEAIDHLIEGLDPAKNQGIKSVFVIGNPRPPRNLKTANVQVRYFILTWDQPKYGSNYQIDNYTVEQKTETSDSFEVVETLPYTQTGMMVKDLKPATQYMMRFSSNSKYGRSYGVILTQATLPDKFIQNLILIIVLPLSLAVLFIVVVCLKFRPTFKPNVEHEYETELWVKGNWREIPRSNVKLQEKLGEGAFGEVHKGLLKSDNEIKPCAVKKLKANATAVERRDLINELKIMVTVGEHPNIVSLIGACTRGEPILVVVRLAENGCLLNLLKKNRENAYINVESKNVNLTDTDKIRIARDVANGMLHLSSKVCVHRDLAARNVLLGEDNVAMVSDFGLSRDVYESGEYENISGGMLPVRWMALESLEDYTYNIKTDVWSFGVVLWEIESGGKMPYSGLGGIEVVDFLKSGKRLKQPDGCSDEISEIILEQFASGSENIVEYSLRLWRIIGKKGKSYQIMMCCWNQEPSKRPSFGDLVKSLDQQLKDKKVCLEDKKQDDESMEVVNLGTEVGEEGETDTLI